MAIKFLEFIWYILIIIFFCLFKKNYHNIYFKNIDLGASLLPTYTSIFWYKNRVIDTYLVSISCLILEIKFILFFQAVESFGVYFAIILGVVRKISSFLFILFLIIVSFAHAFIILL